MLSFVITNMLNSNAPFYTLEITTFQNYRVKMISLTKYEIWRIISV